MENIVRNPNWAYCMCKSCGQYLEVNAVKCEDCEMDEEIEYWESFGFDEVDKTIFD